MLVVKNIIYLNLLAFFLISVSCNDIATNDNANVNDGETLLDDNESGSLEDREGQAATTKSKKKNAEGDIFKFKKKAVVDSWGTGGTAFTILVPSGWDLQGQVVWTLDCPPMPAYSIMQATSPDKKKKFEVFPTQVFVYNPDPYFNAYVPDGAKDHGALITKGVPDCLGALRYWVVQQYRGNVNIIEEKTLAEPTYYQMQGSNSSSQPGLIRIEYTEDGVEMEENIYGAMMVLTSKIDGITNWWLPQCYGVRAPKGELKKNLPMFQTMISSLETDPLWYSAYKKTSDQLIAQGWQQMAANARAAQSAIRSNTVSGTDEVSDIMMNGWKSRQATEDKMHDNFTNYVRGVDNYSDPSSGNTYKLPTGYNTAYKNNWDEYIITSDPSFNPTDMDNTNWVELNKQ